MVGSLNRVTLLGNAVRDPEIRSTQDGRKIANLSIATSEQWKDKNGEKKEKTEYHRVVSFSDGLSGVIEKYVKKGSKVYIEGSLSTRKWTDKEGIERYSTEVVLQGFSGTLILLSRSGGDDRVPDRSARSASRDSSLKGPAGKEMIDDDEIPF